MQHFTMAAVHVGCVLALLVTIAGVGAYNYLDDIGNVYAPTANVREDTYVYPTGFIFGAASAAFQIEGAWNVSGKGPSIWDDYLHERADKYPNNGDVADNSYYLYQQDVTLVKNTKLNAYRFSLSWSRLLPNGTNDTINQAGVDYYNNVINELISNGITPVVTLYHFDLPSALEAKGGWAGGPDIQEYFVSYARFAFETFGDRVQWWITFNEPVMSCQSGYESTDPMSYSSPGVGLYQCSYNLLLAHAKAYKAYYEDFSLQGGQIGITNVVSNAQPLSPSDENDQEAANRYMEFQYAWFADPVVFGDYPQIMRDTIDANSKAEGRQTSRLPVFTDEEKNLLRGSTDFLGTNHYTTITATPATKDSCSNVTSYNNDIAVTTGTDPSWTLGTHWSTKTPWGFRRVLNWIKDRYHNLPVLVTENGYNGNTEEHLNDYNRISLHSTYIRALLRSANDDNCNVIGYMVWSLMDNLEWTSGFSQRFGIHYVDFDDPNRKRTPKKSATFLRGTATSKKVTYYGFTD